MIDSVSDTTMEVLRLIDSEHNPGKLLRVQRILTTRKDQLQYDNVKKFMVVGGNTGEMFTVLDQCKLYSPSVMIKLIGRNHYSGLHKVNYIAGERHNGNLDTDISRKNLYFKLSLILNKLYRADLLPFKDMDGYPVPITPADCVVDNPVDQIKHMINTTYLGHGVEGE